MNNEEEILDAVVIDATRDLCAVVCWTELRGLDWCIIGTGAANSYAPPTIYSDRLAVAVDADAENLVSLFGDLTEDGFAIRQDARGQVAHAIREGDGHRLRVSLHHGPRFRSMPGRATPRVILGRALPVAALPDVVAALLTQRADPGATVREQTEAEMHLFRLAEADPDAVDALLPADLRSRAEADRTRALAYPDGDGWGEQVAA